MGLELDNTELAIVDNLFGDYAAEHYGHLPAGPDLDLWNRIRIHLGLDPEEAEEGYSDRISSHLVGPPADFDLPDGYVARLVDGTWKAVPAARRQRDPLADIYANPELFEAT